jgi:FkbM family methyltransferase
MDDYVQPPSTEARRMSRPPKTGIVLQRGIKIPLGPHITPEIWKYMGAYETYEAEVIDQRLEPDDVVIELGGGIGFTSALCAKRIGSENVHVYEADPSLREPIEELYRLNDVAPDLHMYSLGPSAGTMQFYKAEGFWRSSSVPSRTAQVRSKLPIRVEAFEDEIALYPRRPSFLVMDIEGGEYEFLRTVPLTGIRKILCEVHPGVLGAARLHDLQRHLYESGFARDNGVGTDEVWYLERQEPSLATRWFRWKRR